MKISDYIISFLVQEKINFLFEICGGVTTHLLDSIYLQKKLSAVSTHHEQAAAMAAEGYARINRKMGVAMATSGPGATNLITGIGSCFFDSVPALFITGQVNTYEFKLDKPVRQVGFQETKIVQIVKPLMKYAVRVTNPHKIRYHLEKAVYLAHSGRPGPVLLDLPMNIQRQEIKPSVLEAFPIPQNPQSEFKIKTSTYKTIIKLLKNSHRPVILVGGGVRTAGAESELVKLIKKIQVPVVTSLMGIDALSHDSPLHVGMIGTYGNRYANLAVANADFLLVLGSRLDTRQTGTKPKTFARAAKIIHVDVDPQELDNKVKTYLAIQADLKDFLIALNENLANDKIDKFKPWLDQISIYKKRYPSFVTKNMGQINPNDLMNRLSSYLPTDGVVSVDVGQNQMWAAQSLKIGSKQRFLTQGGMAALGSALPMAIGASFANPHRTIVVIAGDGGFQFSLQELETIKHYNLPIKIILLNNHCYGMVKQFQEQYFAGRFQSTVLGYSAPDFVKVAKAFGLKAFKISRSQQIEIALGELFNDKQSQLLEIDLSSSCQTWPKLSVDQPIENQDPLLPKKELQSNMLIPLVNSV